MRHGSTLLCRRLHRFGWGLLLGCVRRRRCRTLSLSWSGLDLQTFQLRRWSLARPSNDRAVEVFRHPRRGGRGNISSSSPFSHGGCCRVVARTSCSRRRRNLLLIRTRHWVIIVVVVVVTQRNTCMGPILRLHLRIRGLSTGARRTYPVGGISRFHCRLSR